MIGIIGAMDIEIEGILAIMQEIDTKVIGGMGFHAGKIGGRPVCVARCGVGKVNAAMCAQAMILAQPVRAIINLGAAGAIDAALDIGDVVVSSDLVQHDMCVGTLGYATGQVPGLDVAAFAADEALARAALAAYGELFDGGSKAHHGRIATGDQFINSAAQKQQILADTSPLCVEMEGAAIAQVCYLNAVPFVAIRAISDRADGAADEDFAAFVARAAENSAKVVIHMMEAIGE